MNFYRVKMISNIYGTYEANGIPGNSSAEAIEYYKNRSPDDGNWQIIEVEEIPAEGVSPLDLPEEEEFFTEEELIAQGYDYTKLGEYMHDPNIDLKIAGSMEKLYNARKVGVVPMHEVERIGGLAYVERVYKLGTPEFNEYLTSPERLNMLNETGSRLLAGSAEFEEYLNSELRSKTLNRRSN